MSDWLNVGKIVNTHGVRGEVRVISRTDFPEKRYEPGVVLTAFRPDGTTKELTVKSRRPHKQFDLLQFEGLENINDVEFLRDSVLKIHMDELDHDLEEGEYYYHQIIGLHMETESGEPVGVIKEIISPGANDVWVVKRPDDTEVLIPYIEDVVLKVSIDDQKVIISPMEGLLE
ncbi:ribosome maturation factor RimM [Alkalicoccus urumqiensis]|uniref:Ribosome maturation factor RimM n=1 Tax=Alkalicoccus urumqiensis TaxID=1548213 RepID=A0A2P6MG62_ALKUR|nr:ribosome maturation factor RimM [Alkalicoccus urumqiensis]PRO65251.1 ribosome maturation factor RimM [Alkalicoccus urumqiensis]